MKMLPDGTIEGTPEELAAFKHIDAAMSAKDVARAKKSPTLPPKKTEPAPVKKRATQIPVEEMMKIVNTLNGGFGVTASDVARHLGVTRKAAYQRLFRLKELGRVDIVDGKFRKAYRQQQLESVAANG